MTAAPGPWAADRLAPLPVHPRAGTSMVLGIVGVVGFFVLVVPVLVCPLAWYLGAAARREALRDPSRWRPSAQARAGVVLGIVGTGLLALGLVLLALVVGGLALVSTYDSGYGS